MSTNLTRTDETEDLDFIKETYCNNADDPNEVPDDRIETHDGAWIKEGGPAGQPVWRWWSADAD